ncbi:AraC family transcriptional regulator [Microbulbifer taiwanensis]|uniref:Helix-turn-helix domain-containing protein n=1 Tax=Microbulbifer taiwanensis TaxID=986746 RepID=A0ABW1YJH3_9GAMM|nr:helix-turn-helix transcriptional regulator [Microbulbifer taiwanensis]
MSIHQEPLRTLHCELADIQLLPGQGYAARFIQDRPSIGFAFEPQSGEHAVATSAVRAFAARANSMAFLPAGCDVYSQSEQGGEYLKITFFEQPETVPVVARDFNNLMDCRSIRAAHALRRMLLGSDRPDAFALEYHIFQLLGVAQEVLQSAPSATVVEKGLSIERLQSIQTVIEQQLDRPLTVSMLANHCRLSTAHFARAFRKALGQSPHDYVMDRRIARARRCLGVSDRKLVDIAIECGFSSHAHMTAVFRARLGVAPSALRCEAAGSH